MDLGLNGRVAVVGGASKGIGRATAMLLAAEGARVVIAARGQRALVHTADAIRDATGADVLPVECDMSSYDDIKRLVQRAVESYGGLVGSEVLGPGPEDQRLREALAAAWEERHRLADLLRREERLGEAQWSMHGALTSHIDRLLRDVDSDARAELRESWPAPSGLTRRARR